MCKNIYRVEICSEQPVPTTRRLWVGVHVFTISSKKEGITSGPRGARSVSLQSSAITQTLVMVHPCLYNH